MYPYDSSEDPPLAVVTVQVTDPASGKQASLSGKLDTGSGISILPEQTVAQLGLQAMAEVWGAGYDGVPMRLPAYFVTVTLAGCTITKLKVAPLHAHTCSLAGMSYATLLPPSMARCRHLTWLIPRLVRSPY